MSVLLLSEEKIAKTIQTLTESEIIKDFAQDLPLFEERNKYAKESVQDFIHRAVWYGYIANVTAYNVQYRENEPINYNIENQEAYEDLQDAINDLGSLLYNCVTNDGNVFLMDEWMNVLSQIKKKFYKEPEVEIPSWCY